MVVINDDYYGGLKKRQVMIRGPYTDMELTQSMQNFNSAVGSAYSASGGANSLKNSSSTDRGERNKTTNYYLTNAEKKLITTRAGQFAKPGIVPFDVLEDFLYILCYVDDYETMKMVSDVTGVLGLDNANILREPLVILNIPDLAKIGYLANGLAALTKRLDSERYPRGQPVAQNQSSSYGGINNMIATGQAMTSFAGLTNIMSLMTQVTSIMGQINSLVSSFSSDGNVATKIASLTNVVNQVNSLVTNMNSTLSLGGKNNITQSIPLLNRELSNLSMITNSATSIMESLKDVTTSNSYPTAKVDGYNKTLKSFFNTATEITSALSSVSSLLSAIKPPSGAGYPLAAETMLKTLSGGAIPTEHFVGEVLGQNVPQNILAKNPMAQAPSYMARAFFGASSAIALHHRDGKQFPAVPIAIFKTAAAGAAAPAFGMQNASALGGVLSLSTAITSLLGNVSSAISSMHLDNVSNLLGAAATASTELRRSDNAIPIMIALATSFANDTNCPFPTSVFSDGWKIASAVGNMLQKEGLPIPT